MKNHKQLLADFYLALLAMEHGPNYNLYWLSEHVLTALASSLDEDRASIERIFSKMAEEDAKI